MNKKNTLIISSANKIDGWGNFNRMFFLACALKKNKHKITFIIIDSKKAYKMISSNFTAFYLSNDTQINGKILNLIKKLSFFENIIIEYYRLNLSLQKKLYEITSNLSIFDDLLNKYYYATNLFCCQENSNYKIFLNNKKNKVDNFYYGYGFFPLKRFNKIKNYKKKIILISLGGGGYDDVYINVYKSLIKYEKYYDEIHIFFTGIYKKSTINFLKKCAKIKIFENKKNIIKNMQKSFLLITSGGYNKIEANYFKKPIIAIATQKHQEDLLNNFNKKTNIIYIKYQSKKINKYLDTYFNEFFILKDKTKFIPLKIVNHDLKVVDLLS